MRKKSIENRSWETYGVAFWIVMAIVSVLMAGLGLVTFGFALLRIIYGDHWFMWFVLAASGAGAFALSYFCFDLFPTWAAIVRTIRLSDARMSGAMSISQINKYEERENRRTNEVKDKVQESYTKVGKDVLATQRQVSEMDEKVNKMLASLQNYNNASASPNAFSTIESSISALNRKLENYAAQTNATIKKLGSQLDEIEKIKDQESGLYTGDEDFDFNFDDDDVPALGINTPDDSDDEKEDDEVTARAKSVFGSDDNKEGVVTADEFEDIINGDDADDSEPDFNEEPDELDKIEDSNETLFNNDLNNDEASDDEDSSEAEEGDYF